MFSFKTNEKYAAYQEFQVPNSTIIFKLNLTHRFTTYDQYDIVLVLNYELLEQIQFWNLQFEI